MLNAETVASKVAKRSVVEWADYFLFVCEHRDLVIFDWSSPLDHRYSSKSKETDRKWRWCSPKLQETDNHGDGTVQRNSQTMVVV